MALQHEQERGIGVSAKELAANQVLEDDVDEVSELDQQGRELDFNSPAAALAVMMLVDIVNEGGSIEVDSSGVILTKASLKNVPGVFEVDSSNPTER
jgi:hypothetical protein